MKFSIKYDKFWSMSLFSRALILIWAQTIKFRRVCVYEYEAIPHFVMGDPVYKS